MAFDPIMDKRLKKYTDIKTDFVVPSPNLFDKSKAVVDKYVDPQNGTINNATTNDTSDFIKIDPSTYYVKNVKGNVAFYDNTRKYISGVNENTALMNVSFQSPSNARYVRFSIKKSEGYSINSTQFEKGQIPTDYKSFDYKSVNHSKLDVKKGLSFTSADADFILPSKNLFDKNKATIDKYVNPDFGTLATATSSDTSDFIPVEPSTDYVKNVKGHVAYYDIQKTYISGINENTVLANVSFKTPTNTRFLRFSIKKAEGFSIETAQLEKGKNSTAYSSFQTKQLDTEKVNVPSESARSFKGRKWASVGDSITDQNMYQPLVAGHLGLNYTECGFPGYTTAGLTQQSVLDSIPSDSQLITVMAGTNDHGQNVPINDVEGFEYSTGTYPGSIRRMIQLLQEKFPNAQIIFANCVGGRGLVAGENMTYQPKNTEGNTTEDYANKCKEVCHEMSIPCIDVFGESGINQLNRATYISDLVHPNQNGHKRIANVFINGLKKFEPVII